MGITIKCRKTGRSIDMGCGGFSNLRNKVADLVGGAFGSHYMLLSEPHIICMSGEKREQFYVAYDKHTEYLMQEESISIKVVDFLFQSNSGGKIRYGACKELLKVIGDYDDNIMYGYCGRKDCAMFADFKAILEDCVQSKSDMVWS